MQKSKISASTIIRTVVLVLALVNQWLTAVGKSPIPISDEQVQEAVSLIITIAASVASWWYNNSFTQAALKADEFLTALKDTEAIGGDWNGQ